MRVIFRGSVERLQLTRRVSNFSPPSFELVFLSSIRVLIISIMFLLVPLASAAIGGAAAKAQHILRRKKPTDTSSEMLEDKLNKTKRELEKQSKASRENLDTRRRADTHTLANRSLRS